MIVDTLFITNQDDISVEYLISKLFEKSLSYLRINSDDITQIKLNVNPEADSSCIIDDTQYDLSKLKSVFFRRTPTKFNKTNDPNAPYLNNEKRHFFEGFYLAFDQAKWINPMFATHIAERKLYQLKIATRLGLTIPKSIVTNDLNKASVFLKNNQNAIIKPISNGLQVIDDTVYSIYTSSIKPDFFDNQNFDEIFETPVLLQEKVMNKYDIRVTIVGETIFAVRIKKLNSNDVDWRKPEIEKEYSVIDLPHKLKEQLLKMNRFFNLRYSAIDLIQTLNGDYIFLEINPVGEWVWLEAELGLDISGTIIKEII